VIVNTFDIMSVIQEESTDISVRSYWPSVVASGAMLLATDALSIERTHGTFLLAECNLSPNEHFDFAYLQGSAELLLQFAMTYDAYAGQLLREHVFNTSIQRNVTEQRAMIYDEGFGKMCNNLTDLQRTELTLKFADDLQLYILTVDELRDGQWFRSGQNVTALDALSQTCLKYLLS